jgi:hypothetical protein
MSLSGPTEWRYHCPLDHVRVQEQPDGRWYCSQCKREYDRSEISDTHHVMQARKQRRGRQ